MKLTKAHKEKRLSALLNAISALVGVPFGYETAVKAKAKQYIWVEHHEGYGGYRAVLINVKNGGHEGAFGQSDSCPRLKYEAFERFLTGVLWGLQQP